MPRQYQFFDSMRTKEEEVDRTKENLFGAGIGAIGGAIFGAATGFLFGGPGGAAAGTVGGAKAGAAAGALVGAQPGLTQELSDQFLPPTQLTQFQQDFGQGYSVPQDPWIGGQAPQGIPVDYMAQMSQARPPAQYAPNYMSDIERYG